jgi:hypothetical protein
MTGEMLRERRHLPRVLEEGLEAEVLGRAGEQLDDALQVLREGGAGVADAWVS